MTERIARIREYHRLGVTDPQAILDANEDPSLSPGSLEPLFMRYAGIIPGNDIVKARKGNIDLDDLASFYRRLPAEGRDIALYQKVRELSV